MQGTAQLLRASIVGERRAGSVVASTKKTTWKKIIVTMSGRESVQTEGARKPGGGNILADL
jgi:hypothetical protein